MKKATRKQTKFFSFLKFEHVDDPSFFFFFPVEKSQVL